jgi:hypothetical protein
MQRRLPLLALLALAAVPTLAQRVPNGAQATLVGLDDRPTFVENRGQWDDEVLFLARFGGAALWITRDALIYDFYVVERGKQDALVAPTPGVPPRESVEAMRRRGHVVAMRFEGARARRATGHGRRAAYHSYFLGGDPSRWAAGVSLYDEVILEGLYPGVALRLYADGGLPRYDLVLAPGANLAQVRMHLEGADRVTVTEAGVVRMRTSLGPVEQRGLVAYQEGPGGRREVESAFVERADGTLGFVAAGVDPGRPLVLDPLIWATFLGGTDEDYGDVVAMGADGSAIVAGNTSSPGFPTTPGAYDTSYNGRGDIFVTRLSADGTALLWATFLGGTGHDAARGVALGAEGSPTVTGQTWSADFPATPGAYDTSYNGGGYREDVFVARLSADGTALRWATFLGGTDDDYVQGIAVEADGRATVAGSTISADFPTTPGAYDTSHNGYGDTFVTRLSADGSDLAYSTFLGGADGDLTSALALGEDGSATVAGSAYGTDFPLTPDAFDTSHNGGTDAFVARLSADGDSLLYATFLGGTDDDYARGVAMGADGTVVVVGLTYSADFPATLGAYDTTYNGGVSDGFAARMDVGAPPLPFALSAAALNSPVPRGDSLRLAVTLTNASPEPLVLGLRLDLDGPGSFTYADTLTSELALAAGTTVPLEFSVPTDTSFPFGAYVGRVTAKEGDAILGRATFSFAVVVGTAAEPPPEAPPAAVVVPNPASDRAALVFTLRTPGTVGLALYDVLGREVAPVQGGWLAAGPHRLGLDVSRLPAGVYVWRLAAGDRVESGRLTVAR